MDVASLRIGRLMDLLENPDTPVDVRVMVRTEIHRRTETPVVAAPDEMTTPGAILMRVVDDLRNAGRCDLAHACMVVFAGATLDPERMLRHNGQGTAHAGVVELSLVHPNTDGGLASWLIGRARARAHLSQSCSLASRLHG